MNYFNYFTEIEDTFVRRRGKHLLLSPLDWALIDGWRERGIPLHIVLRSIESVFDVFDKLPVGTRTIKSLFYCKEEVESQYLEWLNSQIGVHDNTAAETVAEHDTSEIERHIQNAIDKLSNIRIAEMAEAARRAIIRLEEIAKDLSGGAELIDGSLSDVEKVLDRAMLSDWDPVHLKYIRKEITDQLKIYRSEMKAEAYQNTFEVVLLKRLRDDAGIPRLGLYYL